MKIVFISDKIKPDDSDIQTFALQTDKEWELIIPTANVITF